MFDSILRRVASNLERARIPYMVVGGQAVLRYGEPRATKDIDITLGAGVEDVQKILMIAKRTRIKTLVRSPKSFALRTGVLPLADRKTGIRVDFIFSNTLFEQRAIKRARSVRVGKQSVRFASPEDLIIQKIIAGRPRDLEDVASVLLKNRRLNERYITRWLKQFEGVLDASLVPVYRKLIRETRTRNRS
ncbi:MAG: nucleotidyltransferase family protein [Ignavibacteria bacterium]|nr:MAG: nucleotidyltransferase family protein [Ignavibacteria bacterium]